MWWCVTLGKTPTEILTGECRGCASETWIPIKGYETLYEVSDCGRVRSLDRIVTGKDMLGNDTRRRQKGRVLRQQSCSFGYKRVDLSALDSGRGNGRPFAVHRLVLESFVGPPPTERHETRHYPDPNPANNHLTNLVWGTHSENVRDILNAGRHVSAHRYKTRCPQGHEYSGRDSRGTRICHTCRRDQQRAYQDRRNA